jgi:hypothetical protein
MFHATNSDTSVGPNFDTLDVSGSEVLALIGARTMGNKTLHGRAGVGVALYTESVKQNGIDTGAGFTRAYGAFEIGGGLNLGRVRFQMGILFATPPGDPDIPSLGTRFMGTFAIDLWRKAEPLPKSTIPNGPPVAPPTNGALGSL